MGYGEVDCHLFADSVKWPSAFRSKFTGLHLCQSLWMSEVFPSALHSFRVLLLCLFFHLSVCISSCVCIYSVPACKTTDQNALKTSKMQGLKNDGPNCRAGKCK